MPITVLSPFSGRPVKVRDQDAGRAVKDEEGRLFYILPRSDGSGYYGATTRAGNPKEEARAIELENKVAKTQGQAKDQIEVSLQALPKTRSSSGKWIVIVVIVVVAAAAWALFYGPLKQYNPYANLVGGSATPPPPAVAPATN